MNILQAVKILEKAGYEKIDSAIEDLEMGIIIGKKAKKVKKACHTLTDAGYESVDDAIYGWKEKKK